MPGWQDAPVVSGGWRSAPLLDSQQPGGAPPNTGTTAPNPGTGFDFGALMQAFGQGVIGAGKGALQTQGRTLAPLAFGPLGALAMTGPGGYAQTPPQLEPQGEAQGIGKALEQIAEFMAPGGALGRAGKAMGTGGAALAGRMGLEGAASAGMAAMQEGEVGTDALTAGAFGAAGPAAGAGLSALAPRLKAGAEKAMGQFLRPTTHANKQKAAKVVPGLLEKEVSGSRGTVLERAGTELDALGPKYDAIEATQGKAAVDTGAAADALEPLKAKFMTKTAGTGTRPATPWAETRVKQIEELQEVIRTTAPTLESVKRLRTILGEETEKAFGKLPKEKQAAEKIKVAAYDALRKELHKASPDLAALDKEFSFWSNVKDVLKATERTTTGQEGGLLKGMASKATTGIGLFGVVAQSPEALGAAAVGGALNHIVTSPTWKSWSAVKKDQLARALASGRYDEALSILGRGLGGATTQTSAPTNR